MTATRTRPPTTSVGLRGAMAAILAGQALLGAGVTTLGAAVLAVVLVALLTHGLVAGRLLEEGGTVPIGDGSLPDALSALSVVALMGLLDAARPFGATRPVANAALVGAGMLIAVAVVMTPAPFRTLRSSMGVSWSQVAIGLCGIPLGVLTAAAAGAKAVVPPGPSLVPVAVLLVTALLVAGLLGAAAELVLRGVVQTALGRALGTRGILVTAGLSAGAAAVSGSAALAVGAGAAGLLLGWCVERTDSLWGATVAHALLYMTIIIYAGMA